MDQQMEHQEISLKNKIEELETITSFLDQLADAWLLPPAPLMSINLALEEAFTNIVYYAYADQETHQIELSISKQGDKLKICLADDGQPYDPTQAKAPDIKLSTEDRPIGGLGIFLIRKIMDNVHYQRDNGYNLLCMEKQISTPN
jgi:serine/threonine-protein kinase RsbW